MTPQFSLSQGMISTYLICQRRFQLRYIDRFDWPASGVEGGIEKARDLGERFHQMANRVLLGIPEFINDEEEPHLATWWNRFLEYSASLPPGKRWPELTVSVPLGNHYLTGRLDLLILDGQRATIYDWKTESTIPDKEQLEEQLQTRLYLALVVEGDSGIGQKVAPESVSFRYWYVADPLKETQIDYSSDKHREYWTVFQDIAAGIDWLLANQATWPLTFNHGHCRQCPYQIACGREAPSMELGEWNSGDDPVDLEPDWS